MGVDIGIEVGTSSINVVFVGTMRPAAARAAGFIGGLTAGLMACLEDGAGELGFSSPRGMLRETDSVVISAPRVGAATSGERSGPKMGLLVTRGLEEEILSGWDPGDDAAVGAIPIEMIGSVDEEIDSTGRAIREPQADEVREAVRRLLQRGAEAIVVSLRRSPLNPAHETMIREMIEREYPSHYLGAVPVVLSLDHGATLDDGLRTSAALLNAYITSAAARLLYEAEDVLRDGGFTGVMRVLDATGGVARVCKCVPIACADSDLAADRYVSAAIAARRGFENVVILDMGAGDARIACLRNGEGGLSVRPSLSSGAQTSAGPDFWRVGVGSHSVVTVARGRVALGSRLGMPACYGRGDERPTLTDAFVALRLLDLDVFAGHSERTGLEDSRKVIELGVARHLGVSVENAAGLVVRQAVESIAMALREAVSSRGMECREVTLFAVGAAAGAICCDVATQAGIKEVYSPYAGWASSALGGLHAPIQHTYVVYGGRPLRADASAGDRSWYDGVVRGLKEQAVRGMRGEGLSAEDLSHELELEVGIGGTTTTLAAPLSLGNRKDVKEFYERLADRVGGEVATAGLDIRSILLRTAGPRPSRDLYSFEAAGLPEDGDADSTAMETSAAFVGRREAVLEGMPTMVDVFRRESLRPGDIVAGPAFIESLGDTLVVLDGMTLAVDALLGATIGRTKTLAANDALSAHVWA